jgi:hypothetical protein
MRSTNLQNLVILSTIDYDKFRFYPSNRPADHWAKIAESIEGKDFTQYNPIICAKEPEGLFIIDGQNRFKACQFLGKPVYYVIAHNATENDIQRLNVAQRNWTRTDYLNYYCHHGNNNYIKLAQLLDEIPEFSIQHMINTWRPIGTKDSSTSDVFKMGGYKLPDRGIAKIRKVANLYKCFESIVGDIPSKTAFIAALSSLTLKKEFSHAQMKEKIKKYPYLFEGRGRADGYIAMLEDIYNYRQKNKVNLRY